MLSFWAVTNWPLPSSFSSRMEHSFLPMDSHLVPRPMKWRMIGFLERVEMKLMGVACLICMLSMRSSLTARLKQSTTLVKVISLTGTNCLPPIPLGFSIPRGDEKRMAMWWRSSSTLVRLMISLMSFLISSQDLPLDSWMYCCICFSRTLYLETWLSSWDSICSQCSFSFFFSSRSLFSSTCYVSISLFSFMILPSEDLVLLSC